VSEITADGEGEMWCSAAAISGDGKVLATYIQDDDRSLVGHRIFKLDDKGYGEPLGQDIESTTTYASIPKKGESILIEKNYYEFEKESDSWVLSHEFLNRNTFGGSKISSDGKSTAFIGSDVPASVLVYERSGRKGGTWCLKAEIPAPEGSRGGTPFGVDAPQMSEKGDRVAAYNSRRFLQPFRSENAAMIWEIE